MASTSTSTGSIQRITQAGSNTELAKIDYAAAVLFDYDEEETITEIKLGRFVVNMILKHALSPILMCFCMVGNFQWPIAKDAPIIRVGLRSFVFGMPGCLFSLQFPPNIINIANHVDSLVGIFRRFGNYKDLNQRGNGYPLEDNAGYIWKRLRPIVQPMVHTMLTQSGYVPVRSRYDQVTNSAMLRVLRFSAAAKLIGKSMLEGTLRDSQVQIEGANFYIDINAYVSISAFTDVVDAVEISYLVFDDMLEQRLNVYMGNHPCIAFKSWRLTMEGVVAFMDLLKGREVNLIQDHQRSNIENIRGRSAAFFLRINNRNNINASNNNNNNNNDNDNNNNRNNN